MDEASIELRLIFQDDTLLWSEFKANNGSFKGQLEWYCTPSELEEIGKALSPFPNKIPDEYMYDWFCFAIKAYTYDRSGHCALQIYINNNKKKPEELECRFSIVAEAWAIHRLGELLKKFSTLKYKSLKWSANSEDDDLLVENDN
jgi:hypothetical protein